LSSPSPKKVKAPVITSQYDGTNKSTFNSDFGSGSSFFQTGANDPITGKPTKEIVTNSTLNPALQGVANTATSGLQNNLSYLSMDPNQRVGFLTSGQDPLYNVLTDQNNKAFDQNMGRANINAARNGNTNSTALGGTLGQLMSNDQVTKNQILLQALGYGNQTANTNAATQLGALGGLAQLVYPLGSAANSSFQSALNQLDSVASQNAQMELQARMANAQAQNSKKSPWGSIAGAALGVGGALLAPFTGGLSIPIGAALGSGVSGALGGGGGGGGYSGGGFASLPMGNTGYTNSYGGYQFNNPLQQQGGYGYRGPLGWDSNQIGNYIMGTG
jgi:hypothetical protein